MIPFAKKNKESIQEARIFKWISCQSTGPPECTNSTDNSCLRFQKLAAVLVKKIWNTEARKFVRDNRSCTARNKYTTPVSEFLKNFHELCGQMGTNGSVIPFNCLRLSFAPALACLFNDRLYSSGSILTGSFDFKLKHLTMLLQVSLLLQKQSSELRSFKAHEVILSEDFRHGNDHWVPEFPELEMLDMEDLLQAGDDESEDDQPTLNELE